MNTTQTLLTVAVGGPAVMGGVALIARALVYRHGDADYAREYIEKHRARIRAERDEAVRAAIAKQLAAKQGPTALSLPELRAKEPANR